MANFKTAYAITMKAEGGYANNPKDYGKETYKGISRRFHPDWEGWKQIDYMKTTGRSFPDCLALPECDELNNEMVPAFYKKFFWDIFLGDDIQHQLIANELFDTGVNMNHVRAIEFLQESLNFLYYRKGLIMTNPLVVDGKFGPKTFTALDTIKPSAVKLLYKLMNIMQGNHYIERFRADVKQATFMVGWLERVQFAKE